MPPIKSLGGLTRERGINKSTLNIWISTLYHCAATRQSMRKITKTVRQTSEQHVELGRSRRAKEYQDLQKLHSWLQQFNHYDLLKNNYSKRPSGKRMKRNQLSSSRSHRIANNVG